MKPIRLGILGATGAVGKMMLQVLKERNIAIEELRCFASRRSQGKTIQFNGKEILVSMLERGCFEGLDFVLGAASKEIALAWVPEIQQSKAIFIDNSSAFRLYHDVPLVIPMINGKQVLHHQGIISNPNCATIIALMALYPLYQYAGIEKVISSTYQAVSGAGQNGIDELEHQITAYANHKLPSVHYFAKPICNNVIAQIGDVNECGFTNEELKLHEEGQKILNDRSIKLSCTCVRVPVMQNHCLSLYVQTKEKVSLEKLKELTMSYSTLYWSDELATPLEYTNQDLVVLSRVRKDMHDEYGIWLWCCGDQLRIGAATNTIYILEECVLREIN